MAFVQTVIFLSLTYGSSPTLLNALLAHLNGADIFWQGRSSPAFIVSLETAIIAIWLPSLLYATVVLLVLITHAMPRQFLAFIRQNILVLGVAQTPVLGAAVNSLSLVVSLLCSLSSMLGQLGAG